MMALCKLDARQLARSIDYRNLNAKQNQRSILDRRSVRAVYPNRQRLFRLVNIGERHGRTPEMDICVLNRRLKRQNCGSLRRNRIKKLSIRTITSRRKSVVHLRLELAP